MSEEVKNEVTTQPVSKKKNMIKAIISAIIGAALSFGVTFGVITQDQATVINDRLSGINEKAELAIESLKNKQYDVAMVQLTGIVNDSKVLVETSKEIEKKLTEDSKKTTEKKVVENKADEKKVVEKK